MPLSIDVQTNSGTRAMRWCAIAGTLAVDLTRITSMQSSTDHESHNAGNHGFPNHRGTTILSYWGQGEFSYETRNCTESVFRTLLYFFCCYRCFVLLFFDGSLGSRGSVLSVYVML